jgi:hypothetical protein
LKNKRKMIVDENSFTQHIYFECKPSKIFVYVNFNGYFDGKNIF